MENVMTIRVRVSLAAAFVAALAVTGVQSSVAEEREAVAGEFNFSGDAVVLPLEKRSMHPKVTVDLGDGERYVFIVDTGASVNVIDTAVAEKLGLKVVGKTKLGAPGGPQEPADIYSVPVAHVSSATIANAEFVAMDITGFSGGMTQGVLGLALFRDHLLTFDVGASRITVSRDSLSADRPGVVPFVTPDELIQIDMEVAGTVVPTHIDTGSMGDFMLPGEIMGSLPLKAAPQSGGKARLVGGERDMQFGQLDGKIQFAGVTREHPNIAFMTPSSGHGNIGSGVLGEFIVSVDQRSGLIGFQRPPAGREASADNKPRRLGIRFNGMPGGVVLTVAAVSPGSLGERAGIFSGDVLLTLNGKPTEQYDMAELGALFGSSAPLTFDIDREGESKIIVVQ